jgi:uncharacterized protein HemX
MGSMAEKGSNPGRPGFLETLRLGWKPSRERSKPVERTTASIGAKATNGTPAAPATPATPSTGVADKEAAATPPAPNLQERMEGLQGWMAEIERKQGRMTYFGAAAACLAVIAAGAALYLAVTTPNSASKDDFDDLEAQVQTLQEEVAQATTDQTRLKALNTTIQSLNSRLAASEQKANQNAAEIAAVKKAQAQAAQQPAVTPTPAPTPAPTTPPAGDTKP